MNLRNTWSRESKLYREGKGASRSFVIKWVTTLGNWSLPNPTEYPSSSAKMMFLKVNPSEKWRSRGSIPQVFPDIRYGVHWMWNWISWHGHQLDEKVSRPNKVWCRQSGAGPEARHGSGGADPWSAQHMVSSCAGYISHVGIHGQPASAPHSLGKILWFYLYSLSPQILVECVYIFIFKGSNIRQGL